MILSLPYCLGYKVYGHGLVTEVYYHYRIASVIRYMAMAFDLRVKLNYTLDETTLGS